MTETNVEFPILLNSRLIKSNSLEIGAKILHFQLPTSSNLSNISNFTPNRLLGTSLKNMVMVINEDLKKNPVFFSFLKIRTLDKSFIDRLENNKTITIDEVEKLKYYYFKSLEKINYLMSDNVDSLDFGKQFWDVENSKL